MKLFAMLIVISISTNAFAGTFKCGQLSPACETYLSVKTKNKGAAQSEHPEMEDCDDFLSTDTEAGNFDERRCNFCQVVSDLENFGDESEIPNLGWFNEFRPDFNVTDETDTSCNQ